MRKCDNPFGNANTRTRFACSTAECSALGGCSAAGDQGHPHQQGSSDRDPQEVSGSRLYDGAVRRPRYAYTSYLAHGVFCAFVCTITIYVFWRGDIEQHEGA